MPRPLTTSTAAVCGAGCGRREPPPSHCLPHGIEADDRHRRIAERGERFLDAGGVVAVPMISTPACAEPAVLAQQDHLPQQDQTAQVSTIV